MPVTTTKSSRTFKGNGVTLGFACDFRIFAETDVTASLVDQVAGTTTPLALNTDYTISGANDDNGFTVGTTVPVPNGKNLLVQRAIAYTQPTSFTNQGKFFPLLHQDMADRLEMQIQQIRDAQGRVLSLPPGLFPDGNGQLPFPQGGTLLGWSADGSQLVNTGPTGVGAGQLSDVNINAAAGIAGTKLSFLQAGTGAQTRSVQDKQRDTVSVLDFMTAAQVADVRSHGGTLDVTTAFQAALNYACPIGANLFVPAGVYKITAPLVLTGNNTTSGSNVASLHLYGDGHATRILHGFDGKLFTCATANVPYFRFEEFTIISTTAKSAGSVAFYFSAGLVRSRFENITMGGDINFSTTCPAGFFDCPIASIIDTVEFNNIQLEGIKYLGYGIGGGSGIWISGGRVIGLSPTTGVGIYLYGNNGGVYINQTDVINLNIDMKVTADNGTSNREIFISQAAFDSSYYGLYATDGSYINIIGCWAASAREANIFLETTFTGKLNIAGGTVFNAGAIAGGNKSGITINAAAFVNISGVTFQDNQNYGIWCPNGSKPDHMLISGCQFIHNGTGVIAGGETHIVGNSFFGNTTANVSAGSANVWIENNQGENNTTYTTSPNMVATGGTFTYNGSYPYTVYITGGTGLVIFLNGRSILQASDVALNIKKGDAIGITYTTAPTWNWARG